MLSIPGISGSTCDGFSRRELLRVGGVGLFGLSLGQILKLEAQAKGSEAPNGKKGGWGKAKSVILIFLQGGPSHLPDDVGDRVGLAGGDRALALRRALRRSSEHRGPVADGRPAGLPALARAAAVLGRGV